MTIKLNGSTAGSVALDAPASTTGNADITFKLPVADGNADQLLKTDGSGNLGWASDAGKILQVANSTFNGQASLSLPTAYSNNDSYIYYVSQLDTTLTTTKANSKILISGSISGEFDQPDHIFGFIISSTIGGTTAAIDALRGTSTNNRLKISFMPALGYHGDNNGSTPFTTPFSNLYYAPSQAAGTAITIKLGVVSTYYSNRTFKINQAYDSTNNDEHEHLISHMTLMEIA